MTIRDDFDTLLNGGMDEDDNGTGTPEPDIAPNPAIELKGEIERLKKESADLKEQIRQFAEENKEYKDFKQRLFGDPKTEEEKRRAILEEQKYNEDPVGFMEEKLKNLEKRIDTKETKKLVDKALREVQRDYDIDFDKVYPKIVQELKGFSEEAKAKDPKGCLLKACRLAGVLKPKKKDASNYITGEGSSKANNKKAQKSIEEKVKARILGKVKKSNNMFGI